MSYKMGGKLVDQKNRFCNLKQGPKTSKNVLHIVDLAYVPSHEKDIVKIIYYFVFSFNIRNYAKRRIITRLAAPRHKDNENPPVTGAAAIL